ncbi:Sad1 / UNC-like C-terminal family protein [Cryptosporidium meleagridis]|uniref:Sad1 / UNC-like C-terminal family protein n=1 Tax=Cryptosporidium meleagridis TaxID=93969 RepID=A0A2P4Z689_9CRYT|nr:Sad1 / UNC-like C-terminal family protein [Cryptosporidium meleagridis]
MRNKNNKKRILVEKEKNCLKKENFEIWKTDEFYRNENDRSFIFGNRKMSNMKRMQIDYYPNNEKLKIESEIRSTLSKTRKDMELRKRASFRIWTYRKFGKILNYTFKVIKTLSLFLIIGTFLFIIWSSINNFERYGKSKIISTQLFDQLIKKEKLVNLIKQKKSNSLFSVDYYDETVSFVEFQEKFIDIEDQVIELNKKIAILAEIIELSKMNRSDLERDLRESINNKSLILENKLIELNEKLLKEIKSVKNESSTIFKNFNRSLNDILTKEENQNIFKNKHPEIESQMELIVRNLTEHEKFYLKLRDDLENISEEVKLIDEAQDVLRSLIWSMNKRNEELSTFNSESSIGNTQLEASQDQSPEIGVYLNKILGTKLEMQGYNQVDWAQSSMGGKLLNPKSNKFCKTNRDDNNNSNSIIIKSLRYFQKQLFKFLTRKSHRRTTLKVPIYNSECFEPNQLIKSNQEKTIGNCLLAEVGTNIDIQLSVLINVTSVGIDHILFPLQYDNGKTVPRKFSVKCIQGTPVEEYEYGNFTYHYPQNNQGLEIFQVNSNYLCKIIRFTIHSSYGGKHFCLYKLRVYGEQVNNSSEFVSEVKRNYFLKLFWKITIKITIVLKNEISDMKNILISCLNYIKESLQTGNKEEIRFEEDNNDLMLEDDVEIDEYVPVPDYRNFSENNKFKTNNGKRRREIE